MCSHFVRAKGIVFRILKSPSLNRTEETEVGIEGWNELDGSYAFQYSDGSQAGLCKSVIVKCTAIGDLLMVDAAPLSDADTPYSLEIKYTSKPLLSLCYITTSTLQYCIPFHLLV